MTSGTPECGTTTDLVIAGLTRNPAVGRAPVPQVSISTMATFAIPPPSHIVCRP